MKCPRCGEYMTTVSQRSSDPPKLVEKCLFCGYTSSSVTAKTATAPSVQKSEPAIKSSRATDRFKINKSIAVGMLMTGFALLILSAVYSLYVSAFIGLGLTFWGALLLYVTPTKHVSLELLNATLTPALANTEKMLINLNPDGKGTYLPPRYLKDIESSLVFVSSKQDGDLPKLEENENEEGYSKNPNGAFLVPHGAALSRLFEKKLGMSFTATDLEHLQQNLPKLLVENLEIADSLEIKIQGNTITTRITNNVFNEICSETKQLPRTRELMGSLLSSAIACALAKVTGKSVVIEKEEQNQDGKTTETQYRLMED